MIIKLANMASALFNPPVILICPDNTSQNITLSLNAKNGLPSGLVLTTADYRKLSGSLLSLASVRLRLSFNMRSLLVVS